jgi:hypothetical protein
MSTHTPRGVLATGRTTTTGASSATSVAGSLGAALPDGPGAAAALGLGEPADGVGRADRDGCAERAGCALSDVRAIGSGVAAATGGGGGGVDFGTTGTGSMVYVAWAPTAFGAEPLTVCAPDEPDGGVIVTPTEHVPLLHPG